MDKCIFCNNEFVKPSKEVAMEVGLKLEKSNNLLAIFYQHIFDVCPKCGMPKLDFKDSEEVVVKAKQNKIVEILKNPKLIEIDKNMLIRQAEAKGYICEILNDNIGAVLGYRACVDLLDIYINEFLENVSKNVLNKDGANYKILHNLDMPTFEYAKQHRDLLNRLILGKFDEKVFAGLGELGFLIFLDTILNVVELGIESEKLLKTAENVLDTLKKISKKEEFVPVIEQLENKYLLAKKTYVK